MDDSDYDRPPTGCPLAETEGKKEGASFLTCVFVGVLMIAVFIIAERNRDLWSKLTPGTVRYRIEQQNPFSTEFKYSIRILEIRKDYVLVDKYDACGFVCREAIPCRIAQGDYPCVENGTGEPTWWEKLLQ